MPTKAPRHVACIMDGNGRWAQQRGLERPHGDVASGNAFRAMVKTAGEEDVEWLTLLAFTENRCPEEAGFPVHFVAQHLLGRDLERLHGEGVRVRLLATTDPPLPEKALHRLREAEDVTRDNTRRNLTIAFDHGGRRDVLDAARELITRHVPADRVTEAAFPQYMRCPELPDVDLLIRTGGEHRISDFLLWHCAYAELVFLEILWPDFRAEHLRYALDLYRQRQRRFGHTPADSAPPKTPVIPTPRSDLAVPATPGRPAGAGLLPRLLRLPSALATHLGLILVDGLQETASYANSQPKGQSPSPNGGPPTPLTPPRP
ncbi:polyprenyl diphosphate synthase [Streptomyces sp. CA-250714]|uniref:polyprenyl diphosphate synthase n=1 Tax=Streptomyces sp. CA-250714 TaxID=3240060 RepID=UPI003D8EF934